MKKITAAVISLFLASCGGNASAEFVGTWQDVKSEQLQYVIQKQGSSFLVERQARSKFKPDYIEKSKSVWTEKDGMLTSPEHSVPIIYDKATNQLEIGNSKLKRIAN